VYSYATWYQRPTVLLIIDRSPLGARALMHDIEKLMTWRGIENARVANKENAKREGERASR